MLYIALLSLSIASSPPPPLSFVFGVGGAALVRYHGPGFGGVFGAGLLGVSIVLHLFLCIVSVLPLRS